MSCEINRSKLLTEIKKSPLDNFEKIYFIGGKTQYRKNTDRELAFRQESNFLWLFGVELPNYAGYLDLKKEKWILLQPTVSSKEKIWLGHSEVDYQIETHPIETQRLEDTPEAITALIKQLRLIKNSIEIKIMQLVANISVKGHIQVIKQTHPDMFEYQQAMLYQYVCQAKHQAYLPICGSGRNCAILHYQRNDQRITNGDLCLLDMGMEYQGYASDITVTFPANGKFTNYQAAIYQIVLEANRSVIQQLKPGVIWGDMTKLAQTIILIGLQSLGILKSSANLQAVSAFMPHGLGHHLGLDVHDGRLTSTNSLKENMIVTVEPGIYFIKELMDHPAINQDIMMQYFPIGGVRIEDDVLITKQGYHNFTAGIPRTIDDIENMMRKK